MTVSTVVFTRRTLTTTAIITTGTGISYLLYQNLSTKPTAMSANKIALGSSTTLGQFTVTRTHDSVEAKEDRSHHLKSGKGFVNPWPSYREVASSFFDMGSKIFSERWGRKAAAAAEAPPPDGQIPKLRPVDFGALARAASSSDGMALTWLGHAAFLLSLPGATILLDPCLSERCSPLSFAGPKRVVQLPPNISEKLDNLRVDAVVVSHNHYDHLDLPVMQNLHARNKDIVFFVPLGNKDLLVNAGITNVIECDWWDSYSLKKEKTESSPAANVEITCTPCQHFSSRTAWDRNQTLWSSWHIATPSKRFFFGGDTGYRSVFEGEDDKESELPTCPSFREVKARFGPCDLAALPIGAYEPRHLFSPIHCNPGDAVDVHLDLGSKKSVAMHWGTFPLGFEAPTLPPQVLKEELRKKGVSEEEFLVVDVGETVNG